MMGRLATRIETPRDLLVYGALFHVVLTLLVTVDLTLVHILVSGRIPLGSADFAIQGIGAVVASMVAAETWFRHRSGKDGRSTAAIWGRAADTALLVWTVVLALLAAAFSI